MPLSAADRLAFQELLPALGDDADPRPILHFATGHKDALLDELVAVPGVEKIRAGVLRLLADLEPDVAARGDWVRQAGNAVLVPVGPHPVDRLARHPAWVGLSVLELAKHGADWELDAVERATELAGRAFAAAGTPDVVGEGEVLWALSEEAAEVGWLTTAHELLERAVDAEFADDQRRAEVDLLAAMRRLSRGEDGRTLLERAVESAAASSQTRTHAAWILAHSVEDPAARQGWLSRAAETVDRQVDPEVADRIDAAIADGHRV